MKFKFAAVIKEKQGMWFVIGKFCLIIQVAAGEWIICHKTEKMSKL